MGKHTISLLSALALALMGCSSDSLTDATPSRGLSANGYWKLSLNYRAINLALVPRYDTVRLSVVARDALGAPIDAGTAVPVFTVLDSARLAIDQSGLLSAKKEGSDIRVLVTLQVNGVTRVDTALVRVTSVVPAALPASFSIQPVAPDVAKWTWGGATKRIRPIIRNSANGSVTGLQVSWRSSKPAVATMVSDGTTNGTLEGIANGTTMIFAETYAYGVYLTDSVAYEIGWPMKQMIDVIRTTNVNPGTDEMDFFPKTITIAAGGTIIWRYTNPKGWLSTMEAPGIVFDEPGAARKAQECDEGGWLCADGDIPPITAEWMPMGAFFGIHAARVFPTAGTYTYHDPDRKVTGTIIVKDE